MHAWLLLDVLALPLELRQLTLIVHLLHLIMLLHLLRGRARTAAAAIAEAARRRRETIGAELALHVGDLLLEIALGRLLEQHLLRARFELVDRLQSVGHRALPLLLEGQQLPFVNDTLLALAQLPGGLDSGGVAPRSCRCLGVSRATLASLAQPSSAQADGCTVACVEAFESFSP